MPEQNSMNPEVDLKSARTDELKVAGDQQQLNVVQPVADDSSAVAADKLPLPTVQVALTAQASSEQAYPQGIRSRWSGEVKIKPKDPVVVANKNKSGRMMFIMILVVVAPVLAIMSAIASDPRFSRVFQDPKQTATFSRVLGHLAEPSHKGIARWFYQESYALNPKDVTGLVDMGLMLQKNGDPQGAKAVYERCIKLAPNARMYNNVANIYESEGRKADALAAYTTAIRLDPNWAYAWYNRGCVYRQMGEKDLALSDLNEAIRHNYCTAYFQRAELYDDMGRKDLAKRDRDIINRHGYQNVNSCFHTVSPDEL